jgi:hypothetical protein
MIRNVRLSRFLIGRKVFGTNCQDLWQRAALTQFDTFWTGETGRTGGTGANGSVADRARVRASGQGAMPGIGRGNAQSLFVG